jgi:hypothetical protein
LVLEKVNRTSSLAALLSLAAELLEDHIDAATANEVRWGTWSVLATALSHFPKLGTELELLRSEHNVNLTEDKVDALWTQAPQASDSLALFIPPLVTRGSQNGAGKEKWW